MLPASLRALTEPSKFPFDSSGTISSQSEFYLRPHYRAERPLDATLLKVQSGLDDFICEKYHDQIAAVLEDWRTELLRSPRGVGAIERVLSAEFNGCSFLPSDSHVLRSGPPVEVRRNKFAVQADLKRVEFLEQWQRSLSVFSKLLVAEFQITAIRSSPSFEVQLPQKLHTRVRYEFVGSGEGFHREQRVGYWDFEWETQPLSSSEFRLRSWHAQDETRSRSASPIFADITAATLGANSSYSAQLLHGVDHWRTILDGACGIDIYGHNGVSVADIDNDGFDDLYVCQPAGIPNRLYRNRGDGTFEDVTATSGLGILDNTACALFADFNNDGRQDVIIVRAGGPLLFINQGDGRFVEKHDAFPFATPPQGTFTGAAVADYDRDGWLDVYFCLYVYYQGTDQYKYPVPYHDAENGPPNFMMCNNRDGTFRDVTEETGLNKNNTRYSFCCGWGDYNRDGWPDLYVVNDFGRKNLYRNNGEGTFTDAAAEAGVEDVGAGMSVCWNDFDNDGAEDIYVADMWTAAGERISSQESFKKNVSESVRVLYRKHAMGNSLFRNQLLAPEKLQKSGAFADTTAAAGLGMGRWSWSSDAFDFDHDGFSDLYIANGMISGPSGQDLNSFFWRQVVAKSPDQAKRAQDYEQGWDAINELIRADGTWSGFERNVFYLNNRDGTFSDISGVIGMDFVEDGRAFALADFDQDGRQEVFLKNRNAPQLRVLQNVMRSLPPSIAFRLRGTKSNRDAVGAAITVETELGSQTRMLQVGSGFLSQHSKEVFFGLGETMGRVRASIRWPSGLVQNVGEVPMNHRIWIEEGSEKLRVEPFRMPAKRPEPMISDNPHESEALPTESETWLLTPVPAPDFSLTDLAGRVNTLSTLRGKRVLLNFWTAKSPDCLRELDAFERLNHRADGIDLQVLTVNADDAAGTAELNTLLRHRGLTLPVLRGSDEVCSVYNLLYRYLFDRHRDLGLPTSFLLDERGDITKIYQGAVSAERVKHDCHRIPHSSSERLALALPFPGVSTTFEFGRNYLSLGSVFFQRGYTDQAGEWFELAVQSDPSSAEASYGLGSVYLRQQKTDAARESFERTTKLKATYPDTLANAWNNLGLLDMREGRTDEAIHRFEEALHLSPDHLIALNNLGNAYRVQKDWDAARKTFQHGLEVNPSDPEANYGLAMVYAHADDSAKAYEYLKMALKVRPAYPEALNNLGILYLRTQRRDEAVASFEECIRVAPDFDQSYLNLAKVFSIEGAPEKARATLLELLKQHPDHAQARSMLAQLP
jgi:tetratricopeptide (TPR) repeat protein/peroxiredoxin